MSLDVTLMQIKHLSAFYRSYLCKNVATEIASATDVVLKFRKQFIKRKRIEEMIQNSPKKVFETEYFLIFTDFAFMEA
jgi:hypothetical protein